MQFKYINSITILSTIVIVRISHRAILTELSVEETKRLQKFIEVGVRSVPDVTLHIQLQFAVQTQFMPTHKT